MRATTSEFACSNSQLHLCAFHTTTWGPCRARPVEAPQQRLSVQFGYGLVLCYSFFLSISSDHNHTHQKTQFPSCLLSLCFSFLLSISSDHTWWCCCLINNSRTFHKVTIFSSVSLYLLMGSEDLTELSGICVLSCGRKQPIKANNKT